MTAPHIVDPARLLGEALAEASSDLMRQLLQTMINALLSADADGVSTCRMDKLVKTLGIDSLSKSQVSRMAADFDEHVDQFRHRALGDAGPFTFRSPPTFQEQPGNAAAPTTPRT